MLVDSVDILSFSVDPDHVFVEGYIIRNKIYGFVDYSSQ